MLQRHDTHRSDFFRRRTFVRHALRSVPFVPFYSGEAGAARIPEFLTLEQCRATVSGIGGFCGPNQFYNSQRPASRSRKR